MSHFVIVSLVLAGGMTTAVLFMVSAAIGYLRSQNMDYIDHLDGDDW